MIEGHTDNTPIHTLQYPTNWELSTARATTVVRWLIANYRLPPARLSAAGYGEYHPLVANTTPENRAKNRRVDIVLLRSDLKGQRPGGQL
jgi:chemotaxis protein MotB